MSNRKRSQESEELIDLEIEDEGTDRSSLSPQSRKRPRVSDSPYSEQSAGESDVSEGTFRSVTAALGQDEDELELLATQIIQEKYSFASDEPNVPSEHGVLERVECYNFMCHDQFQVELGPLINFIVGKNGSGKSAVLTAITLCLGGKASATNRGQSLKSFIKEGKDAAMIVVRIKNQGDGAYLPDDFGRSIVVERHFTKNGTSSFKIKSDSGRIISTKRAELDAIIDHFTLQFENPMNVLSQDMARQFLSSSSPAEKYKFFVKGVQLEQLDQDYRLIEESCDQIAEKLRSKMQDISILEDRRNTAQKRLDLSDQHETLRHKLRNRRSQMAWAQVGDAESARDSRIAELSSTEGKLAEAEAKLDIYDIGIRGAEGEHETAAEFVKEATAKVRNAQSESEDIKTKLNAKMEERHDLQAEQRRIKEFLKEAETRSAKIRQEVHQETQRLAELHGGGYSQKQEELELAKQAADEAQKRIAENKDRQSRLDLEIKAAEKQQDAAKPPIDRAKHEVREAESVLQNLSREGGGRTSGFPEKMPILIRAIQQEQSFTKRPIGPIGNFVTLLQPKWSSVLESSLGGTLNSFIVTSKRDQSILSGIMQRVNCSVPIFIGGGDPIDTSQHEPHPHFDTVLRALQIEDDLVRRQLVINHGIEQNLLIENLEEASSVLFDGERPKYVKRCYCINKADRRRGIHLSYSRAGEPSQAPVSVYNGNPRMKSDRDSQIRIQRDAISDLKRELNGRQEEMRSAQTHLTRCRQARERHQRVADGLRVEGQRTSDRVEELEEALQKASSEGGDLEILQAALRDVEEEKRLNENSLNDGGDAMTDLMQTLKLTRQELAAKDAEILRLEEELKIAESEQQLITEKKRRIIGQKNETIELIEDLKRNRERNEQTIKDAEAHLSSCSEQAIIICPERVKIDQGETAASLDKKLTKLGEDIARYTRELGATRGEIAADAAKTERAWHQAKQQVDEHDAVVKVLTQTIKHRKERWKIFRSHISVRAKAQFTYLLSERSFRGRLLADHENKLLDLQVEPDITKGSSEGRGARTLSGGEKSFSQVCLLLALWEAMGSPVRCLDEFDVYMDHINRKMAIDMLMYAARRSIGRQFILITPGSRAEITLSPDVRVKELAEPERGQARLSF